MAMYIELKVGNKIIAAYGVQRQEILKGKEEAYTYLAKPYYPTTDGHDGDVHEWKISNKPENFRTVE